MHNGGEGGAVNIVNLDNLTYSGNRDNLSDIEDNPRYEFVKGDICDSKITEKLAQKSDVIINFAAESHVDRSIKDSKLFVKTNIYGTQVLLEAARKSRIKRFIQISTDEVYGSIERGSFTENSAFKPNSPYAASKAAADLLVRSYYVTHRLPCIIVRSCNNFGPYQYPEKIIPLFITNILEGKKVPLYADGSNVREWIYVNDNCDAINFIMHHGVTGEVYNIGSRKGVQNIALTRMILRLLNKDDSFIQHVKDRPGHDKRYSISVSKIRKLGWEPKHKFNTALSKTIEWYRENVAWWKKLKGKNKKKFW
jgi:dTDP-glucose 4,6-dehydratase